MDLKQLFPISYKYKKSVGSLLIGILLYLVVALVAGLLIGFAGAITGWIPLVGAIIGWVLRIAGILVEIYVLVGIILQLLAFFKVIK